MLNRFAMGWGISSLAVQHSSGGFVDVCVLKTETAHLLLNLVSSYLVLLQTGGLGMLYFRSMSTSL